MLLMDVVSKRLGICASLSGDIYQTDSRELTALFIIAL